MNIPAKLNRPKTTFTSTIVALLALTLPAFAHATHGRGHRMGGIGHVPCNDGVVVFSPNTLWPPNHNLVTVDVAYIDNDKDTDAVSLAINSISSNQDSPDGTSQCGRSTGPDWIIGPTPVSAMDPDSAATTLQLRAERCAEMGESRMYTVTVTCTDGAPESSPSRSETVDLTVTVQHDQRHQ